MPAKDAHLYGVHKKRKLSGKEIDSSSSLGFESQLASLISSSKPSAQDPVANAGRARPKKNDIFSKHNKDVNKRALKDLQDVDLTRKKGGSSRQEDDGIWRRNKRRMEDKARLYAALKRGDVDDDDEKYGVDFDRKWAEGQERGVDHNQDSSSGESDDGSGSDHELIEFIDEFGRLIKGTKREAAAEERQKRMQQQGEHMFSARPEMPTNIIYGDAVQAEAFDPEEDRWQKMQELAAKRDKEVTPPPDSHYDASKEVRNRGTGFFQFSTDEEERKRQMQNLEDERRHTEATRAGSNSKMDKRKQEIEERRQLLKKKRTDAKADRFLKDLMGELGAEQPDGGADNAP